MLIDLHGNQILLPEECIVCGKLLVPDMYPTAIIGDEVTCPDCGSTFEVLQE